MKNGKYPNAFAKMIEFINRLDEQRIHYQLGHHRSDAVMVTVAIPGQRWEVEFFEDGSVEVERFLSDGDISDESSLADLFLNEESVPTIDLEQNLEPSRLVYEYAPVA